MVTDIQIQLIDVIDLPNEYSGHTNKKTVYLEMSNQIV